MGVKRLIIVFLFIVFSLSGQENDNSSNIEFYSLSNNQAEFTFKIQSSSFSLVTFDNPLIDEVVIVSNDSFEVCLADGVSLSSKNTLFTGYQVSQIVLSNNSTVQQVIASYSHALANIDVIYQLAEGDNFIRKNLKIDFLSEVFLMDICVWKLSFNANVIFQETESPEFIQAHHFYGGENMKGWGYPVLFDCLYAGLEYPAGYNQYQGNILSMTHYPGRKVLGEYESYSAILGYSERGESAKAFKKYLQSIRVTPIDRPLFVNYNSWMTLMPPQADSVIELSSLFKKELVDKRGFYLDSLTIDDGWDKKESLWEINRSNFPAGFQPVSKALAENGLPMGLWFSPSSSYDHGLWLGANGYTANANRPKWICQSDPKYTENLIKQMVAYVEENNLKLLKLDSFGPICDTDQHPHHLAGIYSKEANVDSYIKLLKALRAAQPDIFLNTTCGIWLSPWWLMEADSLWAEIFDGNPPVWHPAPDYRGDTVTRDLLFQNRLDDYPFFPSNAIEHLGVYKDDLEGLEDQMVGVLGRGCRLYTYYLDPLKLSGSQWDFLASLMSWGKDHSDTLMRECEIIGDIEKGESYILLHRGEGESILVVRNPSIHNVQIELPIVTNGSGEYCKMELLYPYHQLAAQNLKNGSNLDWHLEPFETQLILLTDEEMQDSLQYDLKESLPFEIGGARYEVEQLAPTQLRITLYSDSDSLVKPYFISKQPLAGLSLDGISIEVPTHNDQVLSLISMDQSLKTNRLQNSKKNLFMKLSETNRLLTREENFYISCSENTIADFYMLIRPENDDQQIQIKLKSGKKQIELRKMQSTLISSFQSCKSELPYFPWTYYSSPIPLRNRLSSDLDWKENQMSLKSWIRGENNAAAHQIDKEIYIVYHQSQPLSILDIQYESDVSINVLKNRPTPQNSGFESYSVQFE